MKKGRKTRTKNILALVLCLALLFLALAQALALAADWDIDGIPDSVEQTLLLPQVTLWNPAGNTSYQLSACASTVAGTGVSGEARDFCLDWQTPDLFAILVEPAANCLPTWPLADLKASEPAWGVHYLNQNTTVQDQNGAISGRTIYSDSSTTQSAIRLTVNTSDLTSGNLMGITTWGIPNGYDDSIIYTNRIILTVENAVTSSAPDTVCYYTTFGGSHSPVNSWTSTNGVFPDAMYAELDQVYIEQVCAHEAGHSMELTATYDPTVGYHHPVSTSPTTMDQYVYYTVSTSKSKGTVSTTLTFYFGDRYSTKPKDTPVLK